MDDSPLGRECFLEGSLRAALALRPSPTFKQSASREVEIGDALWQVLDIP